MARPHDVRGKEKREESDYVPVAEQILRKSERCDSLDEVEEALLMFASHEGSMPLAELLLARGAGLNDTFRYAGTTPLGMALASGQHEFAAELVERGAEANYVNTKGHSLLFEAALRADEESLRFLGKLQASFAPLDTCGMTAMATAMCYESLARGLDASSERRRECRELGAVNFDKASEHFESLASTYRAKKRAKQTSEFLKSTFKLAATAVAQVGQENQAPQAAERQAEVRALVDAANSGTGMAGYFRNVRAYRPAARASAARWVRMNQATQSQEWVESVLESDDSMRTVQGLGRLAEKYSNLSALCQTSPDQLRDGD
jgi:hypothetical protein